jgi:hypothetical protein
VPREELAGLDKVSRLRSIHTIFLIKQKGDPIYKQVVPDQAELEDWGLESIRSVRKGLAGTQYRAPLS